MVSTASLPTGEIAEGGRAHAHSRRRSDPGSWIDHLLALLVAASVLVVHNVSYMLNHPFWVDEAWVADSTRVPLGLLPWITSSTPLGWTALLRLFPAGGGQDMRLLPLGFTALTGALGYYVGRELPLPRYLGGLLTGAAVVLVPAMLLRDDLKQYTAEACVSVGIMLLLARVERHWTRGRLVALVALATGGLLLTNSTVFVGIAATAALVLAAVVRRDGRQIRQSLSAFGATLLLSGLLYNLLDRRHAIPGLTAYWDGYYVPRNEGLGGAWSFVDGHFVGLAPYMGTRWVLINVGLALVAIVGMVRLRRVAIAAVLPFTLVLVVVASVARLYPFGDLRTSTFWLVLVALYMAIGLGCLVRIVATWNRPVAFALTVVLLAVSVLAVHPYLRFHPIPDEDVRSQIAYVNLHRRPGDIVILDYSASWGFAYYDQQLTPDFEHFDLATTGFLPTYPTVPWLVQMSNRNPADVVSAVSRAKAKLQQEGGHPTGRIWIIRSHLMPPEADAWSQILAGQQVQVLDVGPEPLLLYRPTVVGAP
jgi:hypothetical protein